MNVPHLAPSLLLLAAESVEHLSSLQHEHLGIQPSLHWSEDGNQHQTLHLEQWNPVLGC
jgi:hypothetical protein